MITHDTVYRCPYCNHANELTEPSEGEMVTCSSPTCGKEFRVELPTPEPESNPSAPSQQNDDNHQSSQEQEAEQTLAKTASEEENATTFTHEQEEEKPLAVFRSAMIRRYPFHFLGYIGLALLGLVSFIISLMNESLPFAILSLFVLGWGIAILARWWWEARGTRVILTPTSIIVSEGLIAEKTREIHHEHINQIFLI